MLIWLGVWMLSVMVQGAFVCANDEAPVNEAEAPVIVADAPVVEQNGDGTLVAELSQRVAELETRLNTRERVEREKVEREKRQAADWIDLSNEKWTVKLGGHVQADCVNWARSSPAIPANNYFAFRRVRLVADGQGYGVYDLRLQMTLEPEQIGTTAESIAPAVKDAYFSVNEIPLIGRLRIGNFFVPFSLEQVTNDTNNIFLERSIPTQTVYAADRELGIAFYNHTEDQAWTWSGGVFVDSLSEGLKYRIDDNQGLRLANRVTWVPIYDEASHGRRVLHTGLGVLHTVEQDGRVQFRTRPQVNLGPRLIDTGSILADSHTTGNLELAMVLGSFTLQAETFLDSIDQTQASRVLTNGSYVHASYFLTGEHRMYERFGQHGAQFGRNVPTSNFFVVPGGASWGAWELKARWSHLDFSNLNRGQYNDLTLGMNWYWSDRNRVMFDWIHPLTTQQTTYGTTQSDLLALRFDFNW
ncbi:MAG: OprO/OprP family phosphate-selective porin [Planctomycetota bacterium]